MENITKHLGDVWSELWKILGSNESWKSDQKKCNDLQQRLVYFNQNHSAEPEYIDDVIQSLSRGYNLVKCALEWHEPTAGNSSIEKPNDTHKARGIQWQLVMVWGGFETITKTLFRIEKKLTPEIIKDFTDRCCLPNYSLLEAPAARANLEKWLNKPACEKKSAIADFLSLENGDKTIIEQWIVQSTPVSTWTDAVKLAKALRNATAHGALSASKVKQWGIQKPLLTLSDNLGEIVIAGMRKLTET